jgi:hypothetical protein
LAPFLLVMRRSAFAVFVFSFHSLSHCFFAASLMALVRADFSGLWVYGWLVDGCSAAFFVSESAPSSDIVRTSQSSENNKLFINAKHLLNYYAPQVVKLLEGYKSGNRNSLKEELKELLVKR